MVETRRMSEALEHLFLLEKATVLAVKNKKYDCFFLTKDGKLYGGNEQTDLPLEVCIYLMDRTAPK